MIFAVIMSFLFSSSMVMLFAVNALFMPLIFCYRRLCQYCHSLCIIKVHVPPYVGFVYYF